MPIIPDWLRAHGDPVSRGLVRQSPGDFQVSETLDYELSGDGEHDFLWLEKQEANTAWVAGKLAGHAGIRESDVGFAGLKDRNAITRQWFSVRRPSAAGTDWTVFELPGVSILKTTRHNRKLRRGAHSGNQFRIAVRDIESAPDRLEERLSLMRQSGLPNYFGEQRFGRNGNNLQLASDLFAGGKLRRNKRSIALSAARSFLFNHILQQRVRDGTWNQLLEGDSACLDGSNSIFAVEHVDAELRERCTAMDLHPGGALWGKGAPSSSGEVLALEQAAVAPFGEFRQGLESQTRQSRRALRIAVPDLRWEFTGTTLSLEFSLTSGSYATAVLRELVHY